jgi:hypothetical protein
MKRATMNLQSVSPEMPFSPATSPANGSSWRQQGQGVCGSRSVTLDTCTIDNKRGNQGLMLGFRGGDQVRAS